jgi:hypothetical protein
MLDGEPRMLPGWESLADLLEPRMKVVEPLADILEPRMKIWEYVRSLSITSPLWSFPKNTTERSSVSKLRNAAGDKTA